MSKKLKSEKKLNKEIELIIDERVKVKLDNLINEKDINEIKKIIKDKYINEIYEKLHHLSHTDNYLYKLVEIIIDVSNNNYMIKKEKITFINDIIWTYFPFE